MNKRDLFLDILFKYIGTPYKWGGDDPSGFDCSGLVNEGLQSIGLIGRKEDLTAATLYTRSRPTSQALPGDLAFYKNPQGVVNHVEVVYQNFGDVIVCIGASGGNSTTTNLETALKQNAFIKIRPAREGVEYRYIVGLA